MGNVNGEVPSLHPSNFSSSLIAKVLGSCGLVKRSDHDLPEAVDSRCKTSASRFNRAPAFRIPVLDPR
jgi:hypothetical protein